MQLEKQHRVDQHQSADLVVALDRLRQVLTLQPNPIDSIQVNQTLSALGRAASVLKGVTDKQLDFRPTVEAITRLATALSMRLDNIKDPTQVSAVVLTFIRLSLISAETAAPLAKFASTACITYCPPKLAGEILAKLKKIEGHTEDSLFASGKALVAGPQYEFLCGMPRVMEALRSRGRTDLAFQLATLTINRSNTGENSATGQTPHASRPDWLRQLRTFPIDLGEVSLEWPLAPGTRRS